jgi:hypothetical protein
MVAVMDKEMDLSLVAVRRMISLDGDDIGGYAI